MKRDSNFFRDEIRSGFYIPSAIKQSWASLLDVLSEIDRICAKYNITYYADWGTVLGAVRHGGFVPWDDDLDICMKRDDYVRFRQVADNELPEGYVIHDFERQNNHWLFLSRVVNKAHICFDEKYLDDNYNFPWLSGVDIFIKDYLYKDPEKEKKRCDEIMHLLAEAEPYIVASGKAPGSKQGEADRATAISLYKKAQEKMSEVPSSEADSIGQIFPWVLKYHTGEPLYFYQDIDHLPFEDTFVPVPRQYNKYLSSRYGDYNKVVKGAAAHGYPAFEEQRKIFEKETGSKLPRFSFDMSMLNRPAVEKSGSLKALAKECMAEMQRLFDETKNLLSENMNGQSTQDSSAMESLSQILQASQQLAVDLGTTIEHVKGENNSHTKEVVKHLENYCEDIYALSDSLCTSEAARDPEEDLARIQSSLNAIESALDEHLFRRNEVLFLPVGPGEWSCFSHTYALECDVENNDVVVVPLPLMPKDFFGRVQLSETKIQDFVRLAEYPAALPVTDYKIYDLALHCPEKIYIQNPYDETNPVLTVPQYYYAQNLRLFTDELIYIPLGPVSEFTETAIPDQTVMDYYVTAPGAIYADKVLVQSENIKTQYVNKLISFSGNAATKEYWNSKISPCENLYTNSTSAQSQRKTILYGIASYEYYEHKDNIKDAISSRIDTLKAASDKLDFEILLSSDSDGSSTSEQNKFHIIVQTIASSNHIVVHTAPSTQELSLFASRFTAYYGSSMPIVQEFIAQKKPVMIANYEL